MAKSEEHIIYFRPNGRVQWEAVALAETHPEAVNLIGCGGRRNGEWLIRLAKEPSPNQDGRQKARPTPSLPLG